jgi:hypothetical protein
MLAVEGEETLLSRKTQISNAVPGAIRQLVEFEICRNGLQILELVPIGVAAIDCDY